MPRLGLAPLTAISVAADSGTYGICCADNCVRLIDSITNNIVTCLQGLKNGGSYPIGFSLFSHLQSLFCLGYSALLSLPMKFGVGRLELCEYRSENLCDSAAAFFGAVS